MNYSKCAAPVKLPFLLAGEPKFISVTFMFTITGTEFRNYTLHRYLQNKRNKKIHVIQRKKQAQ